LDDRDSWVDYFIERRSIEFILGKYGIFTIYVSVNFKFDKQLNLRDIVVTKERSWP